MTGGAGFIGSWVAERYLDAGHRVAVYDNLSRGKRSNVSSGVEFFEGDITHSDRMAEVFGLFEPEVINMHAAHIDVSASTEHPIFDAEQNIMGTLKLLDAAKSLSALKRIVFASTGGALFDSDTKLPIAESECPRPLSPYGISKLACELYVEQFCAQRELRCSILRYANVYGPRQNAEGESGVISVFSKKLRDSQICTIFGDGEQTRDYVDVSDVAEANLLCLNGPDGAYHIGTGVRTSVNGLIKSFGVLGAQPRTRYAGARPGEVKHSALDATKARTLLQWQPRVSLQDGLKRMWEWQCGEPITQNT